MNVGDRISLEYPGRVQPKQSVKTARGHFYTPKGVKENATDMIRMLKPKAPQIPWHGPIELVIRFWKDKKPRVRHQCTIEVRQLAERDYWTTRPDWDNLAKQVCDVLERCRFFVNDSQIARVVVEKLNGQEEAPAEDSG